MGLDIRSDSATAILIESGLKKSALIGHIHVPFSEEEDFTKRLTGALQTVSDDMDLKDCTCVMSVPSNRFFFRTASVPFSETKKIQQMLPYELEAEIPFPADDLVFDFKKIPLRGDNGETRIIAAGTEVTWLQTFITTAENCGIKPNVLPPGGYAIATWLCRKGHSHDDSLFIDFDGMDCTLYLMLSGKIALVRSFPISVEEANSADKIWGHIRRSIAGFESLNEVRVTFGAIFINGFDEESISEKLEKVATIPVRILNVLPPEGMQQSENIEKFPSHGGFNNALACALVVLEGLKPMDFRKGPLSISGVLTEYREKLTKTAVIAGVIIFLWLVGMFTDMHMTQKRVDDMHSQIIAIFRETFPNATTFHSPVVRMNQRINELKEAVLVSGDGTSRLRSVDMLREISRSIPSGTDVRLSQLTANEDGITIKGTTDAFSSAEDIKTRLEKVDGFYSVKLTRTEKDGDRVSFTLKIQANPEASS